MSGGKQISILLEFSGVLDVRGAQNGASVEIPEGATVAGLLHHLKVRPNHHRHVVPFVNGARKRLTHRLEAGDRVFLTVPIGGG
jgi:sulfur carrier protein ThiS